MSNLLPFTSQLLVILDNLMNGVYFVNRDRIIAYWNAAAERISGFSAEEVVGHSCRDSILLHAIGNEILCGSHCPLQEVMDKRTLAPLNRTVSMRHKNGYRILVRIRCLPLLDAEGNVMGAVEIFERAYDQETAQIQIKALEQIAYLDALTEIPNRRCVEDTLEDWLKAYYTRGWSFAVVMADIDFFKNVNDQYGHDKGDLVLKKIADTLQQNLRSLDIVGRWGGEEFLLLLQNIPVDRLHQKLESLRQAIENTSVESEDVQIKVTISLGCAIPRDGDTALTLVSRADDLLYKSKREGRNRVSLEKFSAF